MFFNSIKQERLFGDHVHPWPRIGDYTVCLILIKFDIEGLDKMLEGECEFRENWRLICHILPACLNEILAYL